LTNKKVVLRDALERRPKIKSNRHYGLSVGWVFKGIIPYTTGDCSESRITRSAPHTHQGQQGQLGFISRRLFLMHGERLSEAVCSLVREMRRERRQGMMIGLVLDQECVAPSDVRADGGSNNNALKAREESNGKSYMVGFYIPLMNVYAYGTDTLLFELHVKVGNVHIPGSPFLLPFFNPLLP